MGTVRAHGQARVGGWMVDTFGPMALETEERALRLFEEAAELAQACGVGQEKLLGLILHVYGKPAGEAAKEAGQVGVCLLAFCAATGVNADAAEAAEVDRVTSLSADHFRDRQNAKAEKGLGGRAAPLPGSAGQR